MKVSVLNKKVVAYKSDDLAQLLGYAGWKLERVERNSVDDKILFFFTELLYHDEIVTLITVSRPDPAVVAELANIKGPDRARHDPLSVPRRRRKRRKGAP